MSTGLSLHHVGEVVLRALLEGLVRDDRLDVVRCRLHANCSLHSIVTSAEITPPFSFDVNARLAPAELDGGAIGFDGAHAVDVLWSGGDRGVAIEAKLGLGRMACGAFTERFLQRPTLSRHTPPRCNGGMISILDHRGLGPGSDLRLTTTRPAVEVAPPWILVVRAKTWARWVDERPAFGRRAHVIVFDEVAAAYGDATAFDRLVVAQVGAGFHSAWEIHS